MFFHPRFAFIRNYVLRGGFSDGAVGLLVSRMNAYYVFLKLAKLWELQHRSSTVPHNQQTAHRNPQPAITKSAIGNRQSPIDKG
jgi:hypothetical protein